LVGKRWHARRLLNQGNLGTPHAVRTVIAWIEADHYNPAVDETAILTLRQVAAAIAAAWEYPVIGPDSALFQPRDERVFAHVVSRADITDILRTYYGKIGICRPKPQESW
jgi:hypothetical protein